jgi:hypothetical protein
VARRFKPGRIYRNDGALPLHAALRLIDAQVPDSPGAEWFMTSPEIIEAWFMSFQQSLSLLRGETSA